VLYPYYTYDTEKEPVSFRCGFLGSCTAFHRVTHRVPEEAADRLLRMGISNGIFSSESRVVSAPSDGSSGRLPALSEEGFEYLVTGKLVRLYGMAYQPVEPLSTILSWTLSGVTQAWLFGGPGNSPSPHQVHGLVSLEEIRITHLGKEEVLWEGPAEATIERTDSVTSPRQAADEALHGAIIKILNKFNELK